MAEYKPTIGLEIHVGLSTKTKMFCSCFNDHDESHPNINICPICMGHPGTLPTTNEEAIKKLMKVGVALNCKIAEFSKFDRKSYFYPDLPKGYQISQYDLPLCHGGWLVLDGAEGLEIAPARKIRITRIHMEEDAGRLQHAGDGTLVDFNRAGTPLMELVTEPDLKSADDVRRFAQELQLILRYVGASDANMEKGEMRVEVNLSLSKTDELGTKVEVKNINSINAAGRAVEYEIKRQTEVLNEGGKIVQETRGWDENKGKTVSQRLKEGSADYRYFPEPDLPPMRFDKNTAEDVRASLPELPWQRRERFKKEYELNNSQIEIFTVAKHLGDYYEAVASELGEVAVKSPELYTLAANYIITEFPPLLNLRGVDIDQIEGINVSPEAFAELMVLIFNKAISSTGAQAVLKEMAETGLHPDHIIKEKGLGQVSDESELEQIAEQIIANNSKAVEDYKKGKTEVIKFLVGQMMRESKGRANPEIAFTILSKKLSQ